MIWHLMQIVSHGDNCIKCQILFSEKKKKKKKKKKKSYCRNSRPADFVQRLVKVKANIRKCIPNGGARKMDSKTLFAGRQLVDANILSWMFEETPRNKFVDQS